VVTSSVAWSSSSPSVATISSSGLATSVTQGATTITVVSGSVSASASFTVVFRLVSHSRIRHWIDPI
ncbi:MAG: Ig-like domain-containing protein, partial [Limisphaerales bacterium]